MLPTDPVFELVPPIFVQYSGLAYAEIGGPEELLVELVFSEDEIVDPEEKNDSDW